MRKDVRRAGLGARRQVRSGRAGNQSEVAGGVIVTLDVFSGRPNPSWQLGKDQARDLRRRLDGLARAAPRIGRQPPDLGYRGLLVESKGEPWTKTPLRVYGGVVLRAGVRLADPERVVERWLLLTGQGVVDTPLLDALLLDLGQH